MFQLNPSEKLILKVRRHKFNLIVRSFFLSFFVILPPLLFFISEKTIAIKGNDFALFTGLYSMILLVGWMIFFIIWTNYYLDVLIVTDRRIVDVDQKGFFSREVATLSLDKVQDITVTISGILATFLNFGTIKIQSAGESEEFVIGNMPNPDKIKSVIFDLQNKLRQSNNL